MFVLAMLMVWFVFWLALLLGFDVVGVCSWWRLLFCFWFAGYCCLGFDLVRFVV